MYYLLLGEDRVSKGETVKTLTKKHGIAEDSPSRCVYFASEDAPEEILNEAQTMPFFGSAKVIIVHEAEKIPVPVMKRFFDAPLDQTLLIFLSDVNKGKFSSTIEKLFAAHGEVMMFWPMFENKLEQWVERQAANVYRMTAPRGLGRLLVEQCGRSTELLEANLQTLANYFGGAAFSIDQAETVVQEKKEITVFDLVDAVFMGRKKQTLLSFRQLLQEGNEMLYILIMLVRQLEQIWQGMESGSASLKLGKLAVGKLETQMRYWDRGLLASVYIRFAALDQVLKSSAKVLATAEFERNLIEICRLCRR